MDARRPFAAAPDGVRLAVHLTPGAAAERIAGLAGDADGRLALKVGVTAPPEAGKANDALLRLLAKTLHLPRRDLTLAMGAGDRRKVIHIAGDPAVLVRRLEEVLRPWLRPD
jgi:uncharacterized protein